jgi:cell wall-associated NlpC family hydrolase
MFITNDKIELLVQYAFCFVGTPYRWGGDYPTGYDCSGFAQEVLRGVGWDIPGDQTSQQLFDYFKTRWFISKEAQKGSLLFFGRTHERISHVAIALDEIHMIEAGGGDSTTIDLKSAENKNAFVRVRPINNRRDLILAMYPTEQFLKGAK